MAETQVLVSCPFVSPWLDGPLPAGWTVQARPSDYQVHRWRAILDRVIETARLVAAARRVDVLVVSTASVEVLALCLLRPLLGNCRLAVYDPIQPGNARLRRLQARLASRLSLAMCIRRGDLPTWQRSERAAFVPFLAPEPTPGPPAAARETVSVHAAGDAHRDYDLLVEALEGVNVDTTIWTRRAVDARGNPRIEVGPARSPEKGKARQAEAGVSAVLLAPTSLPAGPLVLLDAMAAGAAIVCTRSPGLVDYVEHGVEALVLDEPARPEQLREYLRQLVTDRPLRESLGSSARRRLSGPLARSVTLQQCQDLVDDAVTPTTRQED